MGKKEEEMRIIISILLAVTVLFSGIVYAESSKEKLAIKASNDWLKLVDAAKYSESYDKAAEYFKNAITNDDWQMTMSAVREPLGAVLSRKLNNAQYTTVLPGVPDGEYVVIQYETSFENKKTSIETITPMLDKDGEWRVSGYYIR